ncbi:MAG: DUF952 domain-containing protein [Janthinobacterium lividum]
MMTPIYKIFRAAEWAVFEKSGHFAGSADDLRDGFIHISTAGQLAETVLRHFSGEDGLWRATLDADSLGGELRWEPSRGGALFPHLYRPLEWSDVAAATRIGAQL